MTTIHTIHVSGQGTTQRFTLAAGDTTIGRQDDNGIPLKQTLVSRQHATISCSESGCRIRDLGSANGTLVNGKQLTPNAAVALSHGDKIEIGLFTLVYEMKQIDAPADKAQPASETGVAVEAEKAAGAASAPQPADPKREAAPIAETTRQPTPVAVTPPLPPTVPPAPPIASNGQRPPSGEPPYAPPPGLERTYSRYVQYLPGIYDDPFTHRFLALFESLQAPTEWLIANFYLFLNPLTAPADFLPWLGQWYDITFDDSWGEAQRRQLLAQAHEIYRLRGTKVALHKVLRIYTGAPPLIDDESEHLAPATFSVHIPLPEREVKRPLIERIIDANKPAHTSYTLSFL